MGPLKSCQQHRKGKCSGGLVMGATHPTPAMRPTQFLQQERDAVVATAAAPQFCFHKTVPGRTGSR